MNKFTNLIIDGVLVAGSTALLAVGFAGGNRGPLLLGALGVNGVVLLNWCRFDPHDTDEKKISDQLRKKNYLLQCETAMPERFDSPRHWLTINSIVFLELALPSFQSYYL